MKRISSLSWLLASDPAGKNNNRWKPLPPMQQGIIPFSTASTITSQFYIYLFSRRTMSTPYQTAPSFEWNRCLLPRTSSRSLFPMQICTYCCGIHEAWREIPNSFRVESIPETDASTRGRNLQNNIRKRRQGRTVTAAENSCYFHFAGFNPPLLPNAVPTPHRGMKEMQKKNPKKGERYDGKRLGQAVYT